MSDHSNLHTAVCHGLVNPLITLWISHAHQARYGSALQEGIQFRRAAQSWSRVQAKQHILGQLRHVLRHAQRTTPYYTKLFAKVGLQVDGDFGFDDFARLPVLEREDVVTNEPGLIASDINSSDRILHESGGTTGVPVNCWAGPEEEGWRGSGVYFYQEQAGVTRGNKTAMLWGHHLDPVHSHSVKDRLRNFVHNERWFDCFRLSPKTLDAYHWEMQRWQPHYIVAYADALADLAEHVLEHGYRPSYPEICCITGAEKLYPQQRVVIQRAFGKVYERYGSRETGLIAFQRDPSCSTLYVDWANLLIEPETEDPQAAILVTKLHADAMPMIRYRIGDVALFPPGSTPGHPAFELLDVIGRVTDRIYMPSGNWISGIELIRLMAFLEEDLQAFNQDSRAQASTGLRQRYVREFMFVQRKDYSLDFYLVPTEKFGEIAHRTIEAMVSANLPGLPLRMHLVPHVQRTISNKLRPVMTEIAAVSGEVPAASSPSA